MYTKHEKITKLQPNNVSRNESSVIYFFGVRVSLKRCWCCCCCCRCCIYIRCCLPSFFGHCHVFCANATDWWRLMLFVPRHHRLTKGLATIDLHMSPLSIRMKPTKQQANLIPCDEENTGDENGDLATRRCFLWFSWRLGVKIHRMVR